MVFFFLYLDPVCVKKVLGRKKDKAPPFPTMLPLLCAVSSLGLSTGGREREGRQGEGRDPLSPLLRCRRHFRKASVGENLVEMDSQKETAQVSIHHVVTGRHNA